MVELFNGPILNESCERRDATIVPTQVFALFNSRFANDTALAFAARLGKLARRRRADRPRPSGWRSAACPTAEERNLLLKHYARMAEQERKIAPAETHPRKPLVRSLVPVN